MPNSTLFCNIYTNSICSLIENTEILILPISKKSKYYLGTSMLKKNCSESNLSENIYNALFYVVSEYILQLSMLSHVKYRNSNFTWIKKNLILSRHPNVKRKIALNIICQKKYTLFYSARFCGIYTNSICSLM